MKLYIKYIIVIYNNNNMILLGVIFKVGVFKEILQVVLFRFDNERMKVDFKVYVSI